MIIATKYKSTLLILMVATLTKSQNCEGCLTCLPECVVLVIFGSWSVWSLLDLSLDGFITISLRSGWMAPWSSGSRFCWLLVILDDGLANWWLCISNYIWMWGLHFTWDATNIIWLFTCLCRGFEKFSVSPVYASIPSSVCARYEHSPTFLITVHVAFLHWPLCSTGCMHIRLG